MRTSTRHILSALAFGATILAGSAVAAPTAPANATAARNVDTPQELSIAQISDRLTAAGYTGITEIEREHGAYEVKAIDKNGARVKLDVDPQTGKVLETRRKSRDRD